MLRKYGVCADLPIDESLINDTQIARTLEKALKPHPVVMNGNDQAQEAEALSKIIQCEHQSDRATLVIALLKRVVRTWPPHGCQSGLTRRPPLLAALEAHDTFSEGDEWDNMFDSLIEHAWVPCSRSAMLACLPGSSRSRSRWRRASPSPTPSTSHVRGCKSARPSLDDRTGNASCQRASNFRQVQSQGAQKSSF